MSDLFSLEGRTALVTGGSSGIGAAVVAELRTAGARVLVCGRDEEALRRSGSDPADVIAADLGSSAGVDGLVKAVAGRTDALHLLVNNAGTTLDGDPLAYPEADWDATFDLNLKAVHHLTTALVPLLRAAARPGDPARVVHVGSMDGIAPQTGNPAYGASKAAVHHLARIHARALAEHGITVNAVAPGVFRSRLTEAVLDDPGALRGLEGAIPLGRIGRPEEIGGTVVYLASRAGAFTTGTVLAVDGGITGCGPA